MKNNLIGKKLEYLRKQNGFSQEKLAEETGLNTRTIQRIENGETIPRADSIKRLAEALKVTPDEIIEFTLAEDRIVLKVLNISALGFLLFPLLGIILPLIFWILKRNKIKDVDLIGKKILNFQITWVLLYFLFQLLFISMAFIRIELYIEIMNFLFKNPFNIIIVKVSLYLINTTYIIINLFFIHKKKSVFYKPVIRFLK